MVSGIPNVVLRVAVAGLAVALLVTVGCTEEKIRPARINHYLADARTLRQVNRVVFVELEPDPNYPDMADAMSWSVLTELQNKDLFYVRIASRTDATIQDLGLDRPRRFTIEDLGRIRDALGCDAILVGRMVHFRAYPRTQVSLMLGLIDLRLGRVVWGIDHHWDTRDRETEKRIYAFFAQHNRSGYAPMHGELGMIGPRSFLRFVAHEAVSTLKLLPEPVGRPMAPPATQTQSKPAVVRRSKYLYDLLAHEPMPDAWEKTRGIR